jgi:heat-inducible transcriptional repressor
MSVTDFEQRRKRILEAVVEAYVSTAQPVGSELIARKLRASLSSATIRNIMVELEESGYLEQPHTSAGRVPTDQGYRFYVDSVMDVRRLSPEEAQRMERMLPAQELEVEQFLERVSEVLSTLTQQAAFVVAPTVRQSTVRQIELVPLTVHKVLCVLVANEEMFASHVVEIAEPMSRDESVALVRFINTELVGLPFDQVLGSLERRLLAESDSFYYLVKRSLSILQHALSTEPSVRLYFDGTSYVVAQPEFRRDPHRAHELLRGLEESQASLIERLQSDISTGRRQVRIGREVQLEGLETCSYVTAPFAIGEPAVGGVGVLGPKRMDYARVSALVDAMARTVTGLLTHAGRDG